MSEDIINKFVYEIGDFLDEKVDLVNYFNWVLKEIWDVGDVEECCMIVCLMVKLVK